MVLEKPIGHDLASARAVNDAVGAGLRRVPDLPDRPLPRQGERPEPPRHPLRQHLPRAAVELALGRPRPDHRCRVGRASATAAATTTASGALRDMVQNHLLQLLCLVAMEPPTYVGRETVRDEKLKVLQALQADDAGRRRPRHRARPVRRRAWSTGSRCRRTPRTSGTTAAAPRPSWRMRDRGAELALGRGAVLPAHRQADGPPRLGDRGGVQGAAARDVPAQRGRHRAEPAAHPGPARRGHAPAPDRQGARSRRDPAAAGVARPELRDSLRRSASPTPTSGC